MKTKDLPWGRCSKAIHNRCKNPCGHYLAHHIARWGDCWCHCEPVDRPAGHKTWAAYNRALRFRMQVEEAPMQKKWKYNRETRTAEAVGVKPYSRPHTHVNEKEFAGGV